MGKISTKINHLEQRMSKIEREQQRISDIQVVQLLQERNSAFSDKPRYSYVEISNMVNRSTGSISNLAQRHGLSRRNIKSI